MSGKLYQLVLKALGLYEFALIFDEEEKQRYNQKQECSAQIGIRPATG